jgi:hypothetical protein
MRSCRRRLIWILLAVVAFLVLVAVVSGVLYLLMQQPVSVVLDWQDPIAGIIPEEIAPEWALYPLWGASELETIDTTISYGELETAYAALVFSLDLSDAQRAGRLILLGSKLAESDYPQRAARAYQQIYDVAVLSPRLNDPARADALLATGKGWAEIEQDAQALNAYDQVYTLAVRSPYLQMAHRRDLLTVLEIAYHDLGDSEMADACRAQIIEWEQGANLPPPARSEEPPELPQGEGVVSSAEVGELEAARRQAAGELVQVLLDGGQPPPELVASLAQALQAEDSAKLALYGQSLEGTTQPGKRIDVHWQLIRWLTIKYQVASRGFGLSIVPEWEAQVTEIQSALSKAYEGLFFDYEDLVTALPDASLMGPGSYQVRRLMTLSGQLGQYPNYPAQQMADKLRDAAMALIAAGAVDQLYVDVVAEEEGLRGDGLRHFLNPADQYAQPAQAP